MESMRAKLSNWLVDAAGRNDTQVQPNFAFARRVGLEKELELAKGFEPPTA